MVCYFVLGTLGWPTQHPAVVGNSHGKSESICRVSITWCKSDLMSCVNRALKQYSAFAEHRSIFTVEEPYAKLHVDCIIFRALRVAGRPSSWRGRPRISRAVRCDQRDLCRHYRHLRSGGSPRKTSRESLHHRSFFESSECSETAGGETASKGWLPTLAHLQEGGARMNSSRASFYYRSFFESSESVAVRRDQRDLCRH